MAYTKNSLFAPSNGGKWIQPANYYVHFYKNFDMIVHSHERIEIVYVVLGELKIEYITPSGTTEVILCHPNNYIMIDADIPHKMSVTDVATKIYNIEFSLTNANNSNFSIGKLTASDQLLHDFFTSNQQVIKVADDGAFLQNLQLVQKYIGNNINLPCDNYLSFQFSALFMLIAKQIFTSKKTTYGIVYVKQATKFIYENYNLEITLKQTADACGISQNYLNTIFFKSTGYTVAEFINRYRIQRAAILLEASEMSIEDIYKQVGYHNKANFHKNFSKYLNTTPKKYRNNTRRSTIVQTNADQDFNNYFL